MINIDINIPTHINNHIHIDISIYWYQYYYTPAYTNVHKYTYHYSISTNANTMTNTSHNIYTNSNIYISIDAPTNRNTYTLMMLTVMLSPRLILTVKICWIFKTMTVLIPALTLILRRVRPWIILILILTLQSYKYQ